MAPLKLEHRPGPDATILCQWYAQCFNLATMTRPHPILDDVPICQRCQDKMEEIA